MNASGGGLGEEYIYTTTLRFLQEHGLVATEPPPPDPVAMGATDLLLLQHRSVGWSATTLNTPEGEGSATEGLVNFFEYQYIAGTQSEISASRVQPIAEGVQKGKGDASTPPEVKYYTRQIFRAADHPTDVTHEVTFTEPQASLLAAAPSDPPSTTTSQPPYRVTYFHTEYEAGTTADPDAPRRALWRRVIGPPHKQRPEAGAEWYYPIEREDYDQYGNMSWSATGLVSNPLDPMSTTANDLSSLILTYYDRDANGRSRTTVLDAVPGGDVTLPAGSVELDAASPLHIPVHPDSDQPSGWHRMPVEGASPYVTVFGYDQFGPSDILFCGNVSSGTTQPTADTDTIVKPGSMLLDLTIQHADGHVETIRTTDEHPFWVVGREVPQTLARPELGAAQGEPFDLPAAWKADWRRADLLRPNDILGTLTGAAVVLTLRFTSERQTVYNLEVEGLHSYHVGPDGVVVHNCGDFDYRKAFEEAIGAPLPKDWPVHHRIPHKFKVSRGGPIPDAEVDDILNMYALPKEFHTDATNMWETWRRGHPKATADEIRAFKYEVDSRIMSLTSVFNPW